MLVAFQDCYLIIWRIYISYVGVLCCFSHVWLFGTPWTVARQAPLSMGFSRQEYWSGLPCPPPGDLPVPGIEPASHLHYLSYCPDHFLYTFCVLEPQSSSFLVDLFVLVGNMFPGLPARGTLSKNICVSENVFILLLNLLSLICGHFSYSFCPWGFMSVNAFAIILVEFWEEVEINIDNRVKVSLAIQRLFPLLKYFLPTSFS